MTCETAEQRAIRATAKATAAKARGDWKAVRQAEAEVEQACKAIRSRGPNHSGPVMPPLTPTK